MGYRSYHDIIPAPRQTNRVRMLIFIKRKQGLTYEEFSQYWRGPHARSFTALDIVKMNAITYEQLHLNSHHYRTGPMGIPLMPGWDGIVLLDGESFEKLYAIFESEEYKEKVLPQNSVFVDPESSVLLVDLLTFIEDHRQVMGA